MLSCYDDVAMMSEFQLNGAAYGNGIYLSPSVSMSSGYSRLGAKGGGTPKSQVTRR